MSDPTPFCKSVPARKAFTAWCSRLEALGVELVDVDRYIVATVAAREVALEDLQTELRRTRDLGLRLKIHEAARRASLAFAAGLELLERTFGARVGSVAVRAVAAAGGSTARVIPMPLRLAPKNKGGTAVRARLLAAIARAEDAGRPPTKAALQAAVQGDTGTVLRVLGDLVRSGEVRRIGRGSKGSPFRFQMGVAK